MIPQTWDLVGLRCFDFQLFISLGGSFVADRNELNIIILLNWERGFYDYRNV